MKSTTKAKLPTHVSPQSRTAIYARYSSHNQDDNTSIEIQLDVCRRVAGVPCRDFIDRAVSGTTMSREAFDRLLSDCQAGLIDTVYVYKWDRFGRSARAHVVIADLEEMNIRVISATEGYEPLSRGIQLVVAEDYSRKLSERVVAAKQRRFEQGAWHGGTRPYGYRVITKDGLRRLTPDWDGEAKAIELIFDLYVHDNVGFKQIAREFMQRGMRPRRGEYWSGGAIRMILTNTIYAGRPSRMGKASPASQYHGRAYHDVPTRVERKDEELRIVSDRLFNAAQRVKRNRKALRPTGRNQSRRFSQLLTCGCCGYKFVRRLSGRQPDDKAQWACGLRVRLERKLCANHTYISERSLAKFIEERFQQVFADADNIIAEATADAEKLVKSNRQQADRFQKRIGVLAGELTRLAEKIVDPDLRDRAVTRLLAAQVADKTAERDSLQAQVAELLNGANELTEQLTRAIRQAFDEARASLANVGSPSEYNRFIREFVGPMIVDEDGNVRPQIDDSSPSEHVAEAISYRLLDRKM